MLHWRACVSFPKHITFSATMGAVGGAVSPLRGTAPKEEKMCHVYNPASLAVGTERQYCHSPVLAPCPHLYSLLHT